jgi:uncharacterized protein involved in exopolysaccharide biosynthesis
MLQTLNPSRPSLYEDREQGLDPAHYLRIVRRRIFYFAIPFAVLLIIGFLVVEIQRPIYHSEGKILVESPQIPTTLVQPTVIAAATERIQVIQQRIMTRENLIAIINKFGLFPSERQWMSTTQLLDLMRDRAEIQLVDVDTELSKGKDGKTAPRPSNKSSAVAFTMGFDYEKPELAMKVANDFLTLILDEDVRARTNRATETTQFLAREVKRLQTELDAVNGQISDAKRELVDNAQQGAGEPEELKEERATLTTMKTDLVKLSSVYSAEHPAIKNLKKRIAALEAQIARAQKAAQDPASPQKRASDNLLGLVEKQQGLQAQYEEAQKKYTAARLGENMERDQQAEHLQVIEQPSLPQKPVRPKKLKLFAMSFALAFMVGAGSVVAAEVLDKTIRGSQDLAGVIDSQLLVVIPYITTAGELARSKRRIIVLWALLGLALIVGITAAFLIGVEIDTSWLDRSWISSLTHLTK